ncbi:MAG TPA: phosphopantetheine-binding protein [Opitutaceae bacterium]|nr:phosphopantetheine-binding protein [Opitutaceae bacterium]
MPDPLAAQIKQLIAKTIRLEDVDVSAIPDDEPLVGSGLSIDSIDVLELVVVLEKEYGLKISSSEEARAALGSVSSLVAYIRAHCDPSRLPPLS